MTLAFFKIQTRLLVLGFMRRCEGREHPSSRVVPVHPVELLDVLPPGRSG